MKIAEAIDMKGRLTLQKRNAANEIIEEIAADNAIVLSGRDLVAKLFVNKDNIINIKPISHIAVGTGTAQVNPATDTKLQLELFRKSINPIDLTKDLTTTGNSKKQVRIAAELDFNEANGALTEAALFNDSTDGVMYNRVVFPTINKTSDFKLTLIWDVIF